MRKARITLALVTALAGVPALQVVTAAPAAADGSCQATGSVTYATYATHPRVKVDALANCTINHNSTTIEVFLHFGSRTGSVFGHYTKTVTSTSRVSHMVVFPAYDSQGAFLSCSNGQRWVAEMYAWQRQDFHNIVGPRWSNVVTCPISA